LGIASSCQLLAVLRYAKAAADGIGETRRAAESVALFAKGSGAVYIRGMDEKPEQEARAGMPPHKPTDKQRQTALMLFGLGATQQQVADQLGIDKKTLAKHYREEFESGWERANLQLYGKLWQKGVVDGNPACLIFLAKNRLGMSDRQDLNHSGEAGPPLRAELNLRVVYVLPSDARALPPPPAHLLPPDEFQRLG
jgi:DNA-binding CsgD family transcriptional regulator